MGKLSRSVQITSFDSRFGSAPAAAVLAGCISLVFCASLLGQATASWQTASGAWSIASNWSCGSGFPGGCVPNTGTAAHISNGGIAALNTNAAAFSLTISNGALVADTGGSLIIPPSSSLVNLIVGYPGGTGALSVQNGAILTNLSLGANIGCCSGATGIVNISGAGSQWNNSGVVALGNAGNGTLALNSGATGSSSTLFVGASTGGSGNVTLDGQGTTWTSGALLVGYSGGSGVLTIQNEAVFTNAGAAIIGQTGTGTMNVQNGATFSVSGDLTVGQSGAGSLTIARGGRSEER